MTPTDSLHIVGDMASKIKNNVKEQIQQFSWKLKFPKEVVVKEISTESVMILNRSLKRLRTEFIISPRENAISIVPQTPYKPDVEYFFWAKYRRKEICIAFSVTEDHEMRTFDQKTSMEKLNVRFKLEAKRAAMIQEAAKAKEAYEAQKAQKAKKAADSNTIIDDK